MTENLDIIWSAHRLLASHMNTEKNKKSAMSMRPISLFLHKSINSPLNEIIIFRTRY